MRYKLFSFWRPKHDKAPPYEASSSSALLLGHSAELLSQNDNTDIAELSDLNIFYPSFTPMHLKIQEFLAEIAEKGGANRTEYHHTDIKLLEEFFLYLEDSQLEEFISVQTTERWMSLISAKEPVLELIRALQMIDRTVLITPDFLERLLSGFPCRELARLINYLSFNEQQTIAQYCAEQLGSYPHLIIHLNDVLFALSVAQQRPFINQDFIARLLEEPHKLATLATALKTILSCYPVAIEESLIAKILQPQADIDSIVTLLMKQHRAYQQFYLHMSHDCPQIAYYCDIYIKAFLTERGGAIVVNERLLRLCRILEHKTFSRIAQNLVQFFDLQPLTQEFYSIIDTLNNPDDLIRLGYLGRNMPLLLDEYFLYDEIEPEMRSEVYELVLLSDKKLLPESVYQDFLRNGFIESLVYLRMLSLCVFVAQQDSLLEKFQASSIFVLFTKITERVNAEFLGSCTIERLWALESLLCLAIKQITHYYPKIQNLEAIFPCEPYDNNNAERYQTLLTEIQNNIADLRAHDLKQFIIDNDLIHIWGLSIFSHNMSEHYYDLEEWDSFFLRNLEAISVEYDVLTQQSSRPFLFNHSGLAPLRAETKTSDYENPSTKLGYY